jgi:hypothetical protein
MIHLDKTLFNKRVQELIKQYTTQECQNIQFVWQGYDEETGMKNYLILTTYEPEKLTEELRKIFPLETNINAIIQKDNQVYLNLDAIREI